MVKMGKNRMYWKIEYLTKKEKYSIDCFSPKYYGSLLECKKWINNHSLLKLYNSNTDLIRKITLQRGNV